MQPLCASALLLPIKRWRRPSVAFLGRFRPALGRRGDSHGRDDDDNQLQRPDGTARVAWVDAAKGICIVLVVMMHTTLGLGEAVGREGWMHAVVAFAKPFRMPDFFLLSGLFLARVIDREWRSYADKRVVHFLYFYVLWVLIQFALKGWGLSGGDPAEFFRQLALTAIEPFGTLWFIYLLAVFSAVTKLARRVSPAVLFVAAAALEIAPIHTGWTLIDEFAARYVYFVAGYLFAERIFAFAATAAQRWGLMLAGLAVWASSTASWHSRQAGCRSFRCSPSCRS